MRYEIYNPDKHGEPKPTGRPPTNIRKLLQLLEEACKQPVVAYDLHRGHLYLTAKRYGYEVKTKSLPDGGRVVWAKKIGQEV